MAKPVILAVDDRQVLGIFEQDLRLYPSLNGPLPSWRSVFRPPPFEQRRRALERETEGDLV